ncbi:MAG: HIT domain-containing protein [Candidatus Paceibacterota bacterium]|jgi:diadenosine tetraphosphate (Ap4A) HIT family hydrolase
MARTVNLAHARTAFQSAVMKRIVRDKVCPFCMEHFLKYHTKPIIKEGKYWVLTENFEPYKGSKHHLLAVTKKHVQHFEDLSPAAQAELFQLVGDEARKRGIKGGALFMRFGDTDYTGGTVEHLHAQLVSGGKRGKGKEPLVTYLGYSAKKATAVRK